MKKGIYDKRNRTNNIKLNLERDQKYKSRIMCKLTIGIDESVTHEKLINIRKNLAKNKVNALLKGASLLANAKNYNQFSFAIQIGEFCMFFKESMKYTLDQELTKIILSIFKETGGLKNRKFNKEKIKRDCNFQGEIFETKFSELYYLKIISSDKNGKFILKEKIEIKIR
ncbi:hypothetical protein [Cetobacterium somerae]